MKSKLQLVPGAAPVGRGHSPPGEKRGRLRAWQAKAAAFQAALVVFALTATLIGAVTYTLDRSARKSSTQQTATELSSGARVAASTFSALRANLRVRAGQVATSLELQRAVIKKDRAALERIASTRHAQVVLGGEVIGTIASEPRITSTAAITSGGKVLARVTVAVSIGNELLQLIRDRTPLPPEAALILVQNGRVVAGGPIGASGAIHEGRIAFETTRFLAEAAKVELPNTRILAVEPLRAVEARAMPYRQRLFAAAAATLILAAGLATRIGRPVARLLNDIARLSRQAQTDALTGLGNRRFLDERLVDELGQAQALGTSLAFVIADIDDFKQVNDRYGHQTGDEILCAFARACEEVVRELDAAARWGGEEFAFVLPRTRLAGARRTAERLRRAVAEIVVTGPAGERVQVTASFGAAAYPTFPSVEALVEAADNALYEAKGSGKNRVSVATGPMTDTPGRPHTVVAPA